VASRPPASWRIWRAFGLQPHRVKTVKLSTDPLFVDKVRKRGLHRNVDQLKADIAASSKPATPTPSR